MTGINNNPSIYHNGQNYPIQSQGQVKVEHLANLDVNALQNNGKDDIVINTGYSMYNISADDIVLQNHSTGLPAVGDNIFFADGTDTDGPLQGTVIFVDNEASAAPIATPEPKQSPVGALFVGGKPQDIIAEGGLSIGQINAIPSDYQNNAQDEIIVLTNGSKLVSISAAQLNFYKGNDIQGFPAVGSSIEVAEYANDLFVRGTVVAIDDEF